MKKEQQHHNVVNPTKLKIFLRGIKSSMERYSLLEKDTPRYKKMINFLAENYRPERRAYQNIPFGNEKIFDMLSPELKMKKEVLENALTNNFSIYKKLTREEKLNPGNIALLFEHAMLFSSDYLRKDDIKFLEEIEHYLPGIYNNKKTFLRVMNAASHKEYALGNLFLRSPQQFKTDKALAIKLIKINPEIYRYMNSTIKDDDEIMITAMKSSNGSCFGYFPAELRNDAFFTHYMSQFGYVSPYSLGSELKRKFIESSAEDLNSYLNSFLLKEKLEEEVGQKNVVIKRNKV